jgi:hypothetical protein
MSFEMYVKRRSSLATKMKHSTSDGILQTNFLEVFQKNTLIQEELEERQRSDHLQLMKEMRDYKLKEKLNKELLYTWNKEHYVRQLKQKLQEYEAKRFGVRNAYYEYQARNLDYVLNSQRGLIIPPIEEERRLNVNAKLHQFLRDHPLPITSSMHGLQSADVDQARQKEEEEEEDARGIEQTWKSIHAQSAIASKRKQRNFLPSIQRSSTMDKMRRNKPLTKNLVPSTTVVVSNEPATTISDTVNVSSESKRRFVLPVIPIRSTLSEDIEPTKITSEILEKQTGDDLATMRSIRRLQKNPIDLNKTFEIRKRTYQINKRVYDYHLCRRKCILKYNSLFE